MLSEHNVRIIRFSLSELPLINIKLLILREINVMKAGYPDKMLLCIIELGVS